MGTCKFCGQSKHIETIGEVSQDKLDEIATNECHCERAEFERRSAERREKVEKFLNEEVPEYSRELFEKAIRYVENPETEVEYVAIKTSDGWITKILTNSSGALVINPKKILGKRQEF